MITPSRGKTLITAASTLERIMPAYNYRALDPEECVATGVANCATRALTGCAILDLLDPGIHPFFAHSADHGRSNRLLHAVGGCVLESGQYGLLETNDSGEVIPIRRGLMFMSDYCSGAPELMFVSYCVKAARSVPSAGFYERVKAAVADRL